MIQVASPLSSTSRLAKLVSTGLTDSPVEEAFDRLTRLAARLLRAPVSLVSLVSEERQFFKSIFGLPEPWLSLRETPLTHSLCQHVVNTADAVVIPDCRILEISRHSLAIPDLDVIAYAGMPLTLSNGETLGAFCVIDHVPREWTDDDLSLLKDLSRSVICEIELRLLINAREELQDIIFHDLKNPLSAISLSGELLMKKISAAADSPVRRGVLRIQDAATRMKNIIIQLEDLKRIEMDDLELETRPVSARSIAEAVVALTSPSALHSEIEIRTQLHSDREVNCDPARLVQALDGLISAAIRIPGADRQILVSVEDEPDGKVRFSVSFHCDGFTDAEIRHLFDRFYRSRSFPTLGARLSLCLAKELVHLHGGLIALRSGEGNLNAFSFQLG